MTKRNINSTSVRELFDQFQVFDLNSKAEKDTLPSIRTHRVYLSPETHVSFDSLNSALSVYSQSKSRVLIEDLDNDGYLVYHRDLANSPVKARNLNEAIKLVSELL